MYSEPIAPCLLCPPRTPPAHSRAAACQIVAGGHVDGQVAALAKPRRRTARALKRPLPVVDGALVAGQVRPLAERLATAGARKRPHPQVDGEGVRVEVRRLDKPQVTLRARVRPLLVVRGGNVEVEAVFVAKDGGAALAADRRAALVHQPRVPLCRGLVEEGGRALGARKDGAAARTGRRFDNGGGEGKGGRPVAVAAAATAAATNTAAAAAGAHNGDAATNPSAATAHAATAAAAATTDKGRCLGGGRPRRRAWPAAGPAGPTTPAAICTARVTGRRPPLIEAVPSSTGRARRHLDFGQAAQRLEWVALPTTAAATAAAEDRVKKGRRAAAVAKRPPVQAIGGPAPPSHPSRRCAAHMQRVHWQRQGGWERMGEDAEVGVLQVAHLRGGKEGVHGHGQADQRRRRQVATVSAAQGGVPGV